MVAAASDPTALTPVVMVSLVTSAVDGAVVLVLPHPLSVATASETPRSTAA